MQDSRTDHVFAQRRRRNKAKQDLETALSGHEVEYLTEYQIRVDGVLDFYPTSQRFHHIPSNTRDFYDKAADVIARYLQGNR